jgi:glycosyltransferase involved in cell wall biosynthesis
MSELGVGDSIRYLSGGDTMLANSYRHAALFVFPSKYEGFGIPPLEAMSVGCPVACSDVSSIPEVVGDAGAYFPPDDPAAIRDTVERVLDSDHERSELIRRGKHRCAQFSWRKCAQDTLGIYRSMVKQ